jgi:hypothetical protein
MGMVNHGHMGTWATQAQMRCHVRPCTACRQAGAEMLPAGMAQSAAARVPLHSQAAGPAGIGDTGSLATAAGTCHAGLAMQCAAAS